MELLRQINGMAYVVMMRGGVAVKKRTGVRATAIGLACALAIVVFRGMEGVSRGEPSLFEQLSKSSTLAGLDFFYPVMSYPQQDTRQSLPKRIVEQACYQLFPFAEYVADNPTDTLYATQLENPLTEEEIAQMLALEAADENHVDENGNVVRSEGDVGESETQIAEQVLQHFAGEAAAEADSAKVITENMNSREISGQEYAVDTLSYDFLINHFYVVDSTTSVTSEQLNAQKLLEMDMTMHGDNSKPQILIYHTHSQEEFVDSVKGDSSTTIVGVGEYLAKQLHDIYGYNVIHNTTSYDLVDGKLDRNKAYSLALVDVEKILEENPSIEVVIDLHRDGIDGKKLVTNINGKDTAQFMFFNGLSYTNKVGAIDYLKNPYLQENLSFSLKLQLEAAKYYPGATRKIYLKGYRYNLHVRPKSLLVESGAQNNTLQEQLNAMDVLADVLDRVLTPKQ